MASLHPWAENFNDYEAVFVCQNELPIWEPAACLRAFQTFQFTDATTPGDEASSFAHNETGAIIRYDGGVLAVDYGPQDLGLMFPDLFAVLNNLGWIEAVVYHPAETMRELLSDIGRSIPANLDFDVKPAQSEVRNFSIDSLPEGKRLMDKIKGHHDQGGANIDEVILDGFRNLSKPSEMSAVDTVTEDEDYISSPIMLEDDQPDQFDSEFIVPPDTQPYSPARSISSNLTRPIVFDDDSGPTVFELPEPCSTNNSHEDMVGGEQGSVVDESPIIPVFDSEQDKALISGAASGSYAALSSEDEGLMPSADMIYVQMPITRDADDVIEDNPSAVASESIDLMAVLACKQGLTSHDGAEPQTSKVEVEKNDFSLREVTERTDVSMRTELDVGGIIKIGRSVICFDLPEAPLSDSDLLAASKEHGVANEKILHLEPGKINQSVRWDVMKDIPAEYPFFAAKIIRQLFSDEQDLSKTDISSLVGAFMKIKESSAYPDLRDVLNFDFRPELKNKVEEKISFLVMSKAGFGFFDFKNESGDLAESVTTAFSVRELQTSQTAQMIVLHVDESDGEIGLQIADMLRFLAREYMGSKRFYVAPVADKAKETSSDQGGMVAGGADLQAMLRSMLAVELGKLGIGKING